VHHVDSFCETNTSRRLNFIKSDGVERPFEPASKVPNVVA
jgi:hypothetical protein